MSTSAVGTCSKALPGSGDLYGPTLRCCPAASLKPMCPSLSDPDAGPSLNQTAVAGLLPKSSVLHSSICCACDIVHLQVVDLVRKCHHESVSCREAQAQHVACAAAQLP